MKGRDSFKGVYGLADVKCKKDHSIILDNNVMPHLIPGVNKIELGNIVFTRNNSIYGYICLEFESND